jgi:excisionase family DNA binding protein
LLTIPQAAAVLAVGRTTVYELIGAGDLESVHVGRRLAYPWRLSRNTSHDNVGAGLPCAGRRRADGIGKPPQHHARQALRRSLPDALVTSAPRRSRLARRPTSDGIQLGKVELGKLTPTLVREWRSQLSTNLSPNSVAKCYRLLRTILATAVVDELIVRNPCVIKGAGAERAAERPVATVEQVWALAGATPQRYRCLILLAGFLGFRRGELLGSSAATSISSTERCESSNNRSSSTAENSSWRPEDRSGSSRGRAPRVPHSRTGNAPRPLRRFRTERPLLHRGALRGTAKASRRSQLDSRSSRGRRSPGDFPLSRSPAHGKHDHGVDRRLHGGVDAQDGSRFERSCSAIPARDARAGHRGRASPRRVRRATDTGRSRRFRAMDARWTS